MHARDSKGGREIGEWWIADLGVGWQGLPAMREALSNSVESSPSRALRIAYFTAIAAMLGRITWLDQWSVLRWLVLVAFLLTLRVDVVPTPSTRSLQYGALCFFGLSGAFTYLPDVWFKIAFQLNHAKHYLWDANAWMQTIPGNDAAFLWRHRVPWLSQLMGWIYENGFDMVVWIPVVRSLLAFDARKLARYALGAHLLQFPMIMPFYTLFRVDEVWSVLGHRDLLERGWDTATRLNLGANCFPSMHTSVAYAILLLGLRERSRAFRWMMSLYATSIIVSTMYMEVHWIIDVLGGLLLGWAAVKLADRLTRRLDMKPAETISDQRA
jgi:membrane-associated phospholipid phosphatase